MAYGILPNNQITRGWDEADWLEPLKNALDHIAGQFTSECISR